MRVVRHIKLMASRQPINETCLKKIYFLSASANNICLPCQDEVRDVAKKIRLWKTDGEKFQQMFRNATICEHLLSGRKRFPSNLPKLLQKFPKFRKLFQRKQLARSRALAQEKYTNVKTTRISKFPEPPL